MSKVPSLPYTQIITDILIDIQRGHQIVRERANYLY
jgi:hypothetical protein